MAADELDRHKDLLNALNIFPVADADTGANLAVTVRTAAESAQLVETPDVGELLTLAGQAALEEACGNSGTLFAVFLVSMGESLHGEHRLHADVLAKGLSAGSVRAWSVLTDPVPGTMLSVLEAAAAVLVPGGVEPGSNQQLTDYLHQVLLAAQQAVLDSGQDLEVLRGTRKVDAGALGLLVIMDALRRALIGQNFYGPELWAATDDDSPIFDPVDTVLSHIDTIFPQGYGTSVASSMQPAHHDSWVEVMATMDMSALAAAAARHELAETGDSVIVSAVSQSDAQMWRWRVHVHVPEQNMALDILRKHGTPRNITVSSLSANQNHSRDGKEQ